MNIALFGHMAAGKSTIAAGLEDAGFTRMSFAAPLKNVAALAYGKIDKGEMYEVVPKDSGAEKHLISGREILQGIGEVIKWVDRDFWMKCFMRDTARYETMPLIVDDGRFLFERDYLKATGWLIVGVEAPEEVRDSRYMTLHGRIPSQHEKEHESERDIPIIIAEADIVVDGTADAYENVSKILIAATR
jgi:dephospho-CoA kinase